MRIIVSLDTLALNELSAESDRPLLPKPIKEISILRYMDQFIPPES
jgi:hypothetical protein